jgi:hypothetical protein
MGKFTQYVPALSRLQIREAQENQYYWKFAAAYEISADIDSRRNISLFEWIDSSNAIAATQRFTQ